jgi:hypothetical protein
MKDLSIAFASAALVTGLVGAYYWYASSAVKIKRWGEDQPLPPPDGLQPQELLNRTIAMTTLWVGGMFEAAQETARLNKAAALWTAATAVLAAASSVFGSLGSP